MQKISKFVSAAALAAVLILCMVQVTAAVFAEEDFSPNYAVAVYPEDGYGSLASVADMAVDSNGGIYVLEYSGEHTYVTVYADGKFQKRFSTDGIAEPEKVRAGGGKLYVANSEGIYVCNDDGEFALLITTGTFRDFAVNGSYVYVLKSSEIIEYDVANPLSVKQRQIAEVLRAESMSLSGGKLYYLAKRYGATPDIAAYCLNLSDGTTVSIPDCDPKIPAVSISANERYIAVYLSGGIKFIDAATLTLLPGSLAVDISGEAVEGRLLSVGAMQLTADDRLIVADGVARNIQSFQLSGGEDFTAEYDGWYLGSFSSGEGRFFSQTDVCEFQGKKYVLDDGNRRVQIIGEENGSAKIHAVEIGSIDHGNFQNIAVAGEDEIYVSTALAVYRLTSAGDFEEVARGRNIGALFVSLDSAVYYADGGRIYRLGVSTPVFETEEKILGIAVDLKGENVFALTANGLYKNNTEVSVAIAGGRDIDIDFADTLYVATESSVVEVSPSMNVITDWQVNGLKFADGLILDCSADRIAIDRTNGDIYLNFKSVHAVGKSADRRAATEMDIPVLAPTVNVLDKLPSDGKTYVAQVGGWPSTIIYPFHESCTQADTYPGSYAYEDITEIRQGTTVFVVEELDGYFYVMYLNKFGFILSNNVTVQNEVSPPFTDAEVLHDGSSVYKLPTGVTEKVGAESVSAFEFQKLSKGTAITLLDTVCDTKDLSGVMWYRVKFSDGGSEKIGYVARTNVTRKTVWNENAIRSGKIKADITLGHVKVYDAPNASAAAFTTIRDAAIISVLIDNGGGWLYVEGENEDGLVVRGYVESVYVTNAPLTTAQVVGICLIVSTIVILIAALIVIASIRKRRQNKI